MKSNRKRYSKRLQWRGNIIAQAQADAAFRKLKPKRRRRRRGAAAAHRRAAQEAVAHQDRLARATMLAQQPGDSTIVAPWEEQQLEPSASEVGRRA